jgi:hypothetical protein
VTAKDDRPLGKPPIAGQAGQADQATATNGNKTPVLNLEYITSVVMLSFPAVP